MILKEQNLRIASGRNDPDYIIRLTFAAGDHLISLAKIATTAIAFSNHKDRMIVFRTTKGKRNEPLVDFVTIGSARPFGPQHLAKLMGSMPSMSAKQSKAFQTAVYGSAMMIIRALNDNPMLEGDDWALGCLNNGCIAIHPRTSTRPDRFGIFEIEGADNDRDEKEAFEFNTATRAIWTAVAIDADRVSTLNREIAAGSFVQKDDRMPFGGLRPWEKPKRS